MKSMPFVSARFGPIAVSTARSYNDALMRCLTLSLDNARDLGLENADALGDVLKGRDSSDGTPFFLGLAEELLFSYTRGKRHLPHDIVCSIYDSFPCDGEPPASVAAKEDDITLFPKRTADSRASPDARDSGSSRSFCIRLRHKNIYVLGMTGYYRRFPSLTRRVDGDYPLPKFARQIEDALDTLRILHRDIYDRICSACTFVAPVRRTWHSFTIPKLPRILFLFPDSSHLTHTIAHEFAHYELNCLHRDKPLVLNAFATLPRYSPWRDEPRNPLALLHALYVFCEVAGLLERQVSESDRLCDEPERLEQLERRLALNRARLHQGLDEMQEHHLTPAGQDILRRIARFVSEALPPRRFALEMEQRVQRHKARQVASWESRGKE